MNVFCSVDFRRRYATRGERTAGSRTTGTTRITRAEARAYRRVAANAASGRLPQGNAVSGGIREPTTGAGGLPQGNAAPDGIGVAKRATAHPIGAASAATEGSPAIHRLGAAIDRPGPAIYRRDAAPGGIREPTTGAGGSTRGNAEPDGICVAERGTAHPIGAASAATERSPAIYRLGAAIHRPGPAIDRPGATTHRRDPASGGIREPTTGAGGSTRGNAVPDGIGVAERATAHVIGAASAATERSPAIYRQGPAIYRQGPAIYRRDSASPEYAARRVATSDLRPRPGPSTLRCLPFKLFAK